MNHIFDPLRCHCCTLCMLQSYAILIDKCIIILVLDLHLAFIFSCVQMSSDGLFSQRSHKKSIALSVHTGGGHGNTAIKDPLKKFHQVREKHISTKAQVFITNSTLGYVHMFTSINLISIK